MAAVAELTPVMDGELIELPLHSLIAAGDNPRKEFGDLAELAVSIKANGLLEPIVATPGEHGRYLIVAGHRRHAAAELAALETVPVYVRVMDDQQRVAAMLVENLQRSDLTPLEEAGAFRRLVDDYGMPQRKLAETIGRSQGHISKRLALLELPADVQGRVDSGGITIADAIELAKLKDHPNRIKAALEGQTWKLLAQRVDDQLAEVKHDELLTAREEELESKAIPTIRLRSRWGETPEGAFPLKSSDDWRALQITVAEHKKHGCHTIGLYVDHQGKLREVPICTDRSNHPKVKTKNELSAGPSRAGSAKEERKHQELDAAATRRREFIRTMLTKKPPLPKAEATQLLARTLVQNVEDWNVIEDAAKLLDVHPDIDLSETTLAKVADRWHVVTGTEEDKKGATLITADCGFRGLASETTSPAERETDPLVRELCDDCRDKLLDGEYGGYEEALIQFGLLGEASAMRVAIAIALVTQEIGGSMRNVFSPYREWEGDEAMHLRQLHAHGYEISDVELAQLAKHERSMFPKADA